MTPTFYFHFRSGAHDVPDLTGRTYSDDRAARAEAERLAAEMVETARLAGAPDPDGIIEVADADLRPIVTLPLREAGA